MKKSNVFTKYLFYQLVLPIAVACVITLVYCILYSNYYYLPSWLDFSINFTYQITYIVINLCMFISIGISYYCITFLKLKDILLSTLIPLFVYSAVPFILLLIKSVFFANVSAPISSVEFKNMMESDYLFFFESITKFVFAIIFIGVVSLVLRRGLKKEAKFEKPYIIPKGAIQETALVYYLAWFIYSFVSFVISDSKDILSILTELAYAFAAYLLCVYGSIYIKNLIYSNIEKNNTGKK